MRAAFLIGVVVGILAVVGCASTESAKATIESQPRMSSANTAHVQATVEAVDKENRILTLRTRAGDLRTMVVDPAVKNFDQIRRGDLVVADYLEEVAVYIEVPGMKTKDESSRVTATAPRGNKPAGAVVDTVQRRATVQAIDRENRMVTLHGQDGSVRTIKVPPELGPLDKINAGDSIVIRYTQMVGIGVTNAKATP